MGKYEVPTDRVFITTDYMRKKYGRFDPNVFKRWEKKGLVEKVRNGLYLNGEWNPFHDVDYYSIANELYDPSYVSLISAARYWNFIPETVYEITSVTTRKSNKFEYRNTRFHYHQVKPELFFGYEYIEWEGMPYRIASPEKTLLDMAYLEPLFSDRDWLEGMRFDPYEINESVDWIEMFLLANEIGSETVFKRIALLLEVYDL